MVAAVLTLIGNRLMLSFQTKAKVREELRGFIRELHPETVAWVADLDLFVRELRGVALIGPWDEDEQARVRDTVAQKWDGDLLRRTRLTRFGHPDPDVRQAAEVMEDEMWPIIVNAKKLDREAIELGMGAPTDEQRARVLDAGEAALAELRRAVYAAPRRDVPRDSGYDGKDMPSRLARALARDEAERTRP